MLRVDRESDGQVIFVLSGGITAEDIPALKQLLESESGSSKITLDLKDVLQVNDAAIRFLWQCEIAGIALRNCPAFIRDWIQLQKGRE